MSSTPVQRGTIVPPQHGEGWDAKLLKIYVQVPGIWAKGHDYPSLMEEDSHGILLLLQDTRISYWMKV